MYISNSQHLENIQKSSLLISRTNHGYINMIGKKKPFIDNKKLQVQIKTQELYNVSSNNLILGYKSNRKMIHASILNRLITILRDDPTIRRI